MHREEEIRVLVAQQEADDGQRMIRPEPFVAFSLDAPVNTSLGDLNTMHRFYDSTGSSVVKNYRPGPQCHVHGEYLTVYPRGKMDCASCNRESLEARRRAKGVKSRWGGPYCGHDEIWLYTNSRGTILCRECGREGDRRRHREKVVTRG